MSVLITCRIAGLTIVSVVHLTKLWNATVLMGCVEFGFHSELGTQPKSRVNVSWMSLVMLSSERENKVELGACLETTFSESARGVVPEV